MQPSDRIVDTIYLKGSGKMATQLCQKCKQSHRVAFAITTTKVNAPRRLASIRLPDRITSHTKDEAD